jgi:hypothetical protein
MEQNGKEMGASVKFMRKRQTNPRTEGQVNQRRQLSKFARNGTRELICIYSNRTGGNVSKSDIHKKKETNPRTEPQRTQRHHFSKFARNGSRELIIIYSNRMARKCEQG